MANFRGQFIKERAFLIEMLIFVLNMDNEDFNAFLDVAIGVHGPFSDNANLYMKALARTLKEAGVSLPTGN